MTAVEPRPSLHVSGPCPQRHPLRARAGAFVALTKPRIIELLLVTTVPTMCLAARGLPDAGPVLATVTGGYLSAGGANALNMYLDRDIDARMRRTQHRPVVTGLVTPRECLVFGITLATVSTAWFALLVNPLCAALSLFAILFYVVGYTRILKRRTPQNIVWGGIAGCMPVIIGWAAVTGSLSWAPFALFFVIFFWTPPHYWPLSMKTKDDYASVGVPMLPVVASNAAVARQIVGYSWAMVLASLTLWPLAPTGWLYPAAAVALGAFWLREAHGLLRRATAGAVGRQLKEMRLFHWSITYVTLLFSAVAIDPFLH